jgi:hypothetical protein
MNDAFLNTGINRGSGGGCIDIIVERNHPQQDEKKYLVISSKRYCHEKSIDKYDVGNIYTYLQKVVPHLEKDSQIGILLRDKTDFLTICSNAHSKKYLTHLIRKEDVFSIKDIDDWLNELRSNLNSIEKIKEFCKQPRPVMNLRIHQKYIANMIVSNIHEKHHLITAVCRSGKSYMIAECIRQYMEEYNMHKFLYITNRPSETFNQTKKDIFDKYQEFVSLSTTVVHDVSDQEEKNENFLHLISKQFYQKNLHKLSEEYDVIFFDEAHEASSTEKTKRIMEKASHENTIVIYVTATPYKVKYYQNIPDKYCYAWTLDDITAIQEHKFEAIYKRYPGFQSVKKEMKKSDEDMYNMYKDFPQISWYDISISSDPEVQRMMAKYPSKYGFSMKALFDHNGTNFKNQSEINVMMDRLRDVRDSIRNNPKNTRTFQGDFTGILMFLPYGTGQKIKKTGHIMKEYLKKHYAFGERNYEILFINEDVNPKNVKEDIETKISKAKEDGKRGIILLSGKKIALGISLKDVDVVLLT